MPPSFAPAESVTPLSARQQQARRDAETRHPSDLTTCKRDYLEAEEELMQAMQEHKRNSGRMFPLWDEVLEVLKTLGYKKEA
jgi:hypothetical protein